VYNFVICLNVILYIPLLQSDPEEENSEFDKCSHKSVWYM